jgi:hypothetical protein
MRPILIAVIAIALLAPAARAADPAMPSAFRVVVLCEQEDPQCAPLLTEAVRRVWAAPDGYPPFHLADCLKRLTGRDDDRQIFWFMAQAQSSGPALRQISADRWMAAGIQAGACPH